MRAQVARGVPRKPMLAAALCAWLGCNGERYFYHEPIETGARARNTEFSSLICSGLNRTGFTTVGDESRPSVAGFTTAFFPGAPPFACDRLNMRERQATFSYDLSEEQSLPPDTTLEAIVVVNGIDSGEPVHIVPADPWVPGAIGSGSIGSLPSDPGERATCAFEVRVATADPLVSGAWVASRPLAASPGIVMLPGAIQLDITSEYRAWLDGSLPNFGLVIESIDQARGTKANQRCAVDVTLALAAGTVTPADP